jgi:hypothetical protein
MAIKFGCYIYQEGLDYDTLRSIVEKCEQSGFDSIWIKDNFIPWLKVYATQEQQYDLEPEGGEGNEPVL